MSASIRILALVLLSAPVLAFAVQHRVAPASASSVQQQEKSSGPSTLEEAVARVQNRTGGKVLKADSRHYGRGVEYRIKILTPKGHVRVVTLHGDKRHDDERRDRTNKENH